MLVLKKNTVTKNDILNLKLVIKKVFGSKKIASFIILVLNYFLSMEEPDEKKDLISEKQLFVRTN